jgi:acetoin:2,6-dichlorophenolindophenol oxidoreductase subunit alpha
MTTQMIEPRMELEQNLHMYRQMAKIRAFEEQVNELYKSAKMPGLAHLYVGEEAVAVGVCEALRRDDFITSTHRGHGHCLAKGASVNRMFAELLGKESGYCRGKGGSMHIADPETGNLGANAIVGGSAGIATGAALSAKMRGSNQVAVCFFGDGALGQGLLYEAMNMASLWTLPVIYICENNLYGEYTPGNETIAGEILARPRALAFMQRASTARTSRRSTRRCGGWSSARVAARGRRSSSARPTATTATTSATSTASTARGTRRRSG